MILLIIFLPLFSFLITITMGFIIGTFGSMYLTTSCIVLTTLLSYYLFYYINILGNSYYTVILPWIHLESLQINWGFLVDPLTTTMLCIITSISSLVHFYSSGYMTTDPHVPRFMSYLSLFTFFMILLVSSDNLLQMFIGWEGVGFCSFLLINFWFTRLQANKAALKAMFVNRISDIFLVIGILVIFITFKSVTYTSIFPICHLVKTYNMTFGNFTINAITLSCFFLMVGAMGKSAQIGLHLWLPDAMEGPTPVSALIHAATMVTAGIFLIIRCSPLFEFSDIILKSIVIIGGCTAFFASTIGLLQNDLKKIIAYSTCSQLGYMFFSCGLSNYSGALFHLSNHAFFKALLFLSAGAVIHSLSDEQDIRFMGGLRRLLPLTYIFFLVGSLALVGFPFLTGFYSKDFILEYAYSNYTTFGLFTFLLGSSAAFFTSFYSIRLLYLTFLTNFNGAKIILFKIHESSYLLYLPLIILSIGSIFLGYTARDLFIGPGTNTWQTSIFNYNLDTINAEFIPSYIKLLPLLFSLIGIGSAYYSYTFFLKKLYFIKKTQVGLFVYSFLNKKWLFDKVYIENFILMLLNFSYFFTYKKIDKGFFEFYGPLGLIQIIIRNSINITKMNTGFLSLGLFFFLGIIFLFSLHF